MKKILAFSKKHGTMIKHGALAQLGARHTGSVEVRGSNPLCSTKQVLEEHLLFRRRLRREMSALIPKQKTPS